MRPGSKSRWRPWRRSSIASSGPLPARGLIAELYAPSSGVSVRAPGIPCLCFLAMSGSSTPEYRVPRMLRGDGPPTIIGSDVGAREDGQQLRDHPPPRTVSPTFQRMGGGGRGRGKKRVPVRSFGSPSSTSHLRFLPWRPHHASAVAGGNPDSVRTTLAVNLRWTHGADGSLDKSRANTTDPIGERRDRCVRGRPV